MCRRLGAFAASLMLVSGILVFSNPAAYAIPDYLDLYLNDYYAANATQNCGLCHLNPNGGGARTPFGVEFEKTHQITPIMRSQNGDKFKYPIAKISEALTIHFADPYGQQIVIEAGGKKVAVDAVRQTIDGKEITP
jgi:hypothetical protein